MVSVMKMRLLNVPYSDLEKNNTLSSLNGCICRICVSDDPLEIVRCVGFANSYISMLAQSRFLQLTSEK